jgi:hypothetical protein
MLEIMRSVSNDPPHNESYARRSAWLEACAIDGLRSLRVAFDTLPFDDRTWKAVAEGEQTVGPDDTDSDERFGNANIEIALIQTWLKLFVAAFGAHHILLGKLQLPSLASIP